MASISRRLAKMAEAHCDSNSLHILVPSIVDPSSELNGASTVSRGLATILASPPLSAHVRFVPAHTKRRKHKRLKQLFCLMQSCVSSLPSKALFVHSRQFRHAIAELTRSRMFRLVILNGSDLLWLVDHLPPSIPRLVIAHNVEHLLFQSQIENLPRILIPFKNILTRDLRRLREFEIEGLRAASNVVFLSNDDTVRARSLCGSLNALTIPPLFDYPVSPISRPETGRSLELGFVGDFNWWPNRIAVRWFMDNVLRHMRGSVRLHLYGLHSERVAPRAANVVAHGIAAAFSEVGRRCNLLICPERSGAGVSVKFAEGVYNRIPILATRSAARGLSTHTLADPAIVFRDTAQEWVEFLASDAARRVATSRVSAKTASTFAIETHKDTVQRFVLDTLLMKE